MNAPPRKICFVTGTRAEFGLMRSTLRAIDEHPKLTLSVIVTGTHLSPRHGYTVDDISAAGFTVDARLPWNDTVSRNEATGRCVADCSIAFGNTSPDIVLVVGDRVEAFAAATAAHLGDIPLAHVHGGDRATGQADDSLRHAITKLAHVHLPATPRSAGRLRKLGEDDWRIHLVGAPSIDGIERDADATSGIDGSFVLLALHPTRADEQAEFVTAQRLLDTALETDVPQVVIIGCNNDPGHAGIDRCWADAVKDDRVTLITSAPRGRFLALLRDARLLAGNSSAGIIEAASFGTRVLDIGPRQHGREHGDNVLRVADEDDAVREGFAEQLAAGKCDSANIYGKPGTGKRIADVLADLAIDAKLIRKTIAY